MPLAFRWGPFLITVSVYSGFQERLHRSLETLAKVPYIHPVSGRATTYSLIPDPHAPGLPLPSEIPEVLFCSSVGMSVVHFCYTHVMICRPGALSVFELSSFWAGPGVF